MSRRKNKISIYEEYFNIQREYTKKYGPKVVVLMQIGGFWEVYEYKLPNRKIGKCFKLQRVIANELKKEPKVSKKDGKKEHDIGNPYFWGFPIASFEKWKYDLINLGWHIVQVPQVAKIDHNGRKYFERKVHKFLSKGTDLESIHKDEKLSNRVISIIIELQKVEKRLDQCMVVCGYASIDLVSGETWMEEIGSTYEDPMLPFLRLTRFMAIQPREIVIYLLDAPKGYYEFVSRTLGLHIYDRSAIQVRTSINKEFFKSSYQIQFLKKIYPIIGTDTIEESAKNLTGTAALITSLEYCFEHDQNIITKIDFPTYNHQNDTKHLFISYSTIIQLNLYEKYSLNTRVEHKNITSLLSIIDKTRTHMGRRFLIKRFTKPYVSTKKIEKIYDLTTELIKHQHELLEPTGKLLAKVPDIDRLHRRIAISNVSIMDMGRITKAYRLVLDIHKLIEGIKDMKYVPMIALLKEQRASFEKCVHLLGDCLVLDKLRGVSIESNFIDSDAPIFKNTITNHKKVLGEKNITDYQEAKQEWETNYQLITQLRERIIEITNYKPDLVYKEDLYYLLTTKTALNKIAKAKNLSEEYKSEKLRGFGIRHCVYTEKSKEWMMKAGEARKRYQITAYKLYTTLIKHIDQEYSFLFKPLRKFIALLDYTASNSLCAIKYNYVRPEVHNQDGPSWIQAKEARHPIVEQIINDEFVPNDVSLKGNGLLLYGCNSSGKSTYTKLVGLLIIMAQAGYFIPAKKMVFAPYHHLISRLSGNDNIFTGDSSFMVEMKELRTILKHADPNAMILGDELCRGTETISGTSLTVATLTHLNKVRSSYIFSTHMHHLVFRPDVKYLIGNKRLSVRHLSVKCDLNNDLIYNRKLQPGQGQTMYGLDVARSVFLPKEFMEKAYEVRKEILKEQGEISSTGTIMSTKKSNYNPGVYVDKCMVCGSRVNLETHHIKEQHLANQYKYIGHIYRDAKHNLTVLCTKCHDKHHSSTPKERDSLRSTPKDLTERNKGTHKITNGNKE